MNTGFAASGDLISSVKDSNPAVGFTPSWSPLSWTASIPANTSLKFQVAASNAAAGPFNFVGPDSTAATFFTTSGASLGQFLGNRYLKYPAYLATTDSTMTPTPNHLTVRFTDPPPPHRADPHPKHAHAQRRRRRLRGPPARAPRDHHPRRRPGGPGWRFGDLHHHRLERRAEPRARRVGGRYLPGVAHLHLDLR